MKKTQQAKQTEITASGVAYVGYRCLGRLQFCHRPKVVRCLMHPLFAVITPFLAFKTTILAVIVPTFAVITPPFCRPLPIAARGGPRPLATPLITFTAPQSGTVSSLSWYLRLFVITDIPSSSKKLSK